MESMDIKWYADRENLYRETTGFKPGTARVAKEAHMKGGC